MSNLDITILIISVVILTGITATISFFCGYKRAETFYRNKPCGFCGHRQSSLVTMEEIDKKLDENFKTFDNTLLNLLDTWKMVRHQADLHEKEMHRRVIDAHLD